MSAPSRSAARRISAAELFKSVGGLNVQIVPYKTRRTSWSALLRNDVQMMVDFPPAVKGQVADGKLRILAISGAEALAVVSRTSRPSMRAGVKGYEVISWNGVGRAEGHAEGDRRHHEQGDARGAGACPR